MQIVWSRVSIGTASACHSRAYGEIRPVVPVAFVGLTERELDVLRLIAEGESNATIAGKLVLSEKTVKGYVSNILSKLHIVDRTQAAVFAWQQGLMAQFS